MTEGEGGFDGGQIEVSAEEIAQELGGLVPADKKAAVVRRVTSMMQRVHRGPLPAPEDFAHYDQVLPGCSERIMRLTEKEQDHRHAMERRLVAGEIGIRIFGQLGAIIALALLVALAAYCAYARQPITAAVITAIGAAAVGFVKYSAARVDAKPEAKPPAKQQQRKKK